MDHLNKKEKLLDDLSSHEECIDATLSQIAELHTGEFHRLKGLLKEAQQNVRLAISLAYEIDAIEMTGITREQDRREWEMDMNEALERR